MYAVEVELGRMQERLETEKSQRTWVMALCRFNR
jgi:hypothetical protein